MKRAFRIVFVLVFCLVMFSMAAPALAQANPPPEVGGSFQISPELEAWGKVIAERGAWLIGVIFIDLALGVSAALRDKTFEWQRVADFLKTYGAKALGWMALEVLSLMPQDLQLIGGVVNGAAGIAYGLLLASAVGSVLTNIQSLGLLPVSIPGVRKVQ